MQSQQSTMQQNFDKLSQKLDELIKTLPELYSSQKELTRLEERVSRIEEQNKSGTQWANDEHNKIRTEFIIEIKTLRAELTNGSSLAKTIWIPVVASPIGAIIVGAILHFWH